ncbi:OsmC family protein [Rhodohalobacter mucosus]|uniref:Osmotically inducible protein OsmC n=1 Tax=Rhodohalobacter mucosus TaxID=2079485 RepID=A0A316TM74_9BACT|nr:OsmC family protein [Rhodohalobacter mucosus]PWN05687.1 osmotically inducible protein OsmC [Rhodohalobacter mucosus]
MKITIQRLNNDVHMEAVNEDGVSVNMDGTPDIGGKNLGFRPMQMLLAAAGGCSTIDIIGILKKQRQELDDIRVEITGERISLGDYTEFKTIHLHYILTGKLDKKKVERAIDLSLNKYCSVTKTLEKTATVTSSFEIED